MNAFNCIKFSRFFLMLPLALTLSACDVGDEGDALPGDSSETGASSDTDEPVENTDEPGSSALDEAREVTFAEGDGSVNALGPCPIKYLCTTNNSWHSTSAICKTKCAGVCIAQEYINGYCIPR